MEFMWDFVFVSQQSASQDVMRIMDFVKNLVNASRFLQIDIYV